MLTQIKLNVHYLPNQPEQYFWFKEELIIKKVPIRHMFETPDTIIYEWPNTMLWKAFLCDIKNQIHSAKYLNPNAYSIIELKIYEYVEDSKTVKLSKITKFSGDEFNLNNKLLKTYRDIL